MLARPPLLPSDKVIALTATAAASNKTYNGNTTATVTLSFSGLIGSETLGQAVTAAFNNKNVGAGKNSVISSQAKVIVLRPF